MKISFVALLLQGIPETVAVVTLAFIIAKLPLDWPKIILIGASLAFIAYFVRLFPIPFGIHTIFLLFLLFICISTLSDGDLSLFFTACLLSYLTLAIFETVCLFGSMIIFNIPPKTLAANQVITVVIGETHVLLLFSFAYILKKFYIKSAI